MRIVRITVLFISILAISTHASLAGGEKENKPQSTEKTQLASPDIPGRLIVDFGFNRLSNNAPALQTGFWGSKSLGLYYMKTFELNERMSFNVSLGLGTEKHAFTEDISLRHQTNEATGIDEVVIDSLGFEPGKNKIAQTFLDIPVEFRYYPGASSPSEGNFFIALGGSAGIQMASHMKLKYEAIDGRTIKEKTKDDFGLSNFRYGVHGRIGFRGVNIFYKHYFNPFFKSGEVPSGLAVEPNNWVMGFSFNLF